jgi:hypothetical protein
MNATLSDLLWANGPKLFIDHEGVARSWAVSDDMLRLLDRYVGPDSRTLETGAGVTTVLFAMKGAQHTCIVPFAQEVETIKAYCASKHIPLGRTEFVVDKSETVLPTAKLQPLDLVLIDGAHGFPVPLIDWYFTADHLKVGGHLILDDTHLWSVNILKQFLQDEPEWRLVQDMRPRNAVFEKVQAGPASKNECGQVFVMRRTIELLYPEHLDMLRPYVDPKLMDGEVDRLAAAERKGGEVDRVGGTERKGGARSLAKRALRFLERQL